MYPLLRVDGPQGALWGVGGGLVVGSQARHG